MPAARPPRWELLAPSALYSLGALLWGCPWRVPLAFVSGFVCPALLACVDQITHAHPFLHSPPFKEADGRFTRAFLC